MRCLPVLQPAQELVISGASCLSLRLSWVVVSCRLSPGWAGAVGEPLWRHGYGGYKGLDEATCGCSGAFSGTWAPLRWCVGVVAYFVLPRLPAGGVGVGLCSFWTLPVVARPTTPPISGRMGARELPTSFRRYDVGGVAGRPLAQTETEATSETAPLARAVIAAQGHRDVRGPRWVRSAAPQSAPTAAATHGGGRGGGTPRVCMRTCPLPPPTD